jgi:hypothetical protein
LKDVPQNNQTNNTSLELEELYVDQSIASTHKSDIAEDDVNDISNISQIQIHTIAESESSDSYCSDNMNDIDERVVYGGGHSISEDSHSTSELDEFVTYKLPATSNPKISNFEQKTRNLASASKYNSIERTIKKSQ